MRDAKPLCFLEHLVYNYLAVVTICRTGMQHELFHCPRPCVLDDTGSRGWYRPRERQLATLLPHSIQSNNLAPDSLTGSAICNTATLCEGSQGGGVATSAWSRAAWPADEPGYLHRTYINRVGLIVDPSLGSETATLATARIPQPFAPPHPPPLPL